ncbi:MAG: hypothetical protein AAF726_08175 [Planctomycetota bacterium]
MQTVALLALLLLGMAAFDRGVEARAAAEPPNLVAGPGLLVGTEGADDVELRGRPLMRPDPSLRTVGQFRRALGVGMIAFALVAIALRPPRASRRGAARLVRAIWLVPGIVGIVQLVGGAGASAPTAEAARAAAWDGFALVGLSFLLLAAWRT